jgi:hypothetical protein
MSKKLISLLVVATLACTAWAQEETAQDDPAADLEVAAEEDAGGSAEPEDLPEEPEEIDDGVLDEAFDDESLDEQTYEEDEDDFVPTEEIPADEPIPFPSNI